MNVNQKHKKCSRPQTFCSVSFCLGLMSSFDTQSIPPKLCFWSHKRQPDRSYCNVNACVGHIHILALRNLATCAMSLTLRHGLTLPEVSAQLIKSFDFPSLRRCFETYAKNDNSIFSIRCSIAHFSFRSGYGGPLNLRREKKMNPVSGFLPQDRFP